MNHLKPQLFISEYFHTIISYEFNNNISAILTDFTRRSVYRIKLNVMIDNAYIACY